MKRDTIKLLVFIALLVIFACGKDRPSGNPSVDKSSATTSELLNSVKCSEQSSCVNTCNNQAAPCRQSCYSLRQGHVASYALTETINRCLEIQCEPIYDSCTYDSCYVLCRQITGNPTTLAVCTEACVSN